MEKIVNFELINKYWCIQHNCFHIKNRSKKTFEKCKEFAYKLTSDEIWHRQFKHSTEVYTIKKHKESFGSKKQ